LGVLLLHCVLLLQCEQRTDGWCVELECYSGPSGDPRAIAAARRAAEAESSISLDCSTSCSISILRGYPGSCWVDEQRRVYVPCPFPRALARKTVANCLTQQNAQTKPLQLIPRTYHLLYMVRGTGTAAQLS
jgi:hypothetical protein